MQKAQEAKGVYEEAKTNEEARLSALDGIVESYIPPIPAGTVVEKPSEWDSNNIIPILDGNGTTIPLPKGFYYVGGNYNTGLVISDKPNDTMNATGVDMGNQFVWIPVPDDNALTRTEFDETTPKKSEPQRTGSVGTDVSKNIYDLAGNCYEWTMEANGTGQRVSRGGGYGAVIQVRNRSSTYTTYTASGNSFRCTLYIK